MKMKINQMRAGVILTYLNIGLGSLIPMFYTPIMLRMLGQSEYGLYSLANSVVGYLSLLTFGLGSTIIRYIAKYRVENEKDKEATIIGLFIIMYSALAVGVLIGGNIISNHVQSIFNQGLTDLEIKKIKILIHIMAFNTAISFPISVFGSIIIAHERYIYRQAVNILSTVAAPCFSLIVLYLGFGSIGMAVGSTILQFFMLPLNAGYCFKRIKIYPKFRKIPVKVIKEIVNFSIFVFIGSIVDMLFWATDKVILGMLTNTSVVAVYNIGSTFNTMLTSISTAFSGVLMPRITSMLSMKVNSKELTNLFIRVGRLQFLVIALALSGFIAFGKEFIVLWAGRGYELSYFIALVTLIPLSIPLIQNTGLSIITAQNKHHFRSIVYLIIAIVNVISTYIVVPHIGGFGAALCSGISYIVGQGLIINIYYYKVTKLDILLFWKNIGKLSIVPFIMVVITLYLKSFIQLNTWFTLFVAISIYTLIYGGIVYKFFMNSYEKGIIRNPIMKLLKKRYIQ